MSVLDECDFAALSVQQEESAARIATVVSTPRGLVRGTVVIAPAYESRIQHYSVLSRYLVRHGFRTVRFDLTNHIGLSDGDVFDYTLSGMVRDVRTMLNWTQSDAGDACFVVAPSMAARAAVRALAEGAPCRGAVLLVPVVDLRHTWSQALEMDPLGCWERGEVTDPRTPCRVLRHDIAYECARDALANGFDGLDGTVRDIAAITCPVSAIALERDDWVRASDVRQAMDSARNAGGSVVILDASSHDLSHNPPVVRLTMSGVVQALARFNEDDEPAVRHLDFDELVETVSAERLWARERYVKFEGAVTR